MGRRKTQKIGPLKEGTLRKVGYTVKGTTLSRHKTLRRAVQKYGALTTFHKLGAVGVLTKNTSPNKSQKFIRDQHWVKRKFMQ